MIDPLQIGREEWEQKHKASNQSAKNPGDKARGDQIRLDNDEDLLELLEDAPAKTKTPSSAGSVSGGSVSGGSVAGGSVAGGSVAGAASTAPPKRIVAFGGDEKKFNENFKRRTTVIGNGACRVKSFHGKYSDEGLRYLDNAINLWLDEHVDVEVKFVTSTVMTFEGKTREPALVLNCWY